MVRYEYDPEGRLVSRQRLGGDGHKTLCRVIGGVPERFTLEAQRNSAEIELAAIERQEVSQLSGWRDSLRPAVYTLLLLALGLVILGLRMRLG